MMHGEPMMSEGTPKKEEKFKAPDTAELNEEKREFIEKKLAQYETRLEKAEEKANFTAPEILDVFFSYYDALAKIASAKLLLGGGKVSKQDVEAFVRNSAREFWSEVFHDDSEPTERVLKEHEPAIQEAVKQGWSVLCAYNLGEMGAVYNNEPV